jgi:hypothetical protein
VGPEHRNWKQRHRPDLMACNGILVQHAICMEATAGTPDLFHFDTDSVPLGIDNRCTACISSSLEDFIAPPIPSSKHIIGFGGNTTNNIQEGTIKWSWDDDQGITHSFLIPHSYYVPDSGMRLLSPQHWMQTLPPQHQATASCHTTATTVTLTWGEHHRTIPLIQPSNVATFYLANGFQKFHAFCSEVSDDFLVYDSAPLCHSTELIVELPLMDSSDTHFRTIFPFDNRALPPPREDPQSDILTTHTTVEAEFLHYHYKYGHISPKRIQAMARLGHLPARLATCPIPICTACLYGKATRRPWRTKPTTDYDPPKPNIPGECVSVDFLTSPTPGLIAQLSGQPTHRRYLHAAVYVDQATGYGFVWLQKSIDDEETLQGKQAFEQHCLLSNVSIKHYHADNGIFTSNAWRQACHTSHQSLTFAGVNAHHQNGVAERRIRELQNLARTMIIHAERRWPEAITPNL